MCGIAGTLEFSGQAPSTTILQAMGDRLQHRGPDGQGMHIAGACGLVHRRLAILDPQRGIQPLANADGTVWITYNGEIYNSPDLRRHLQHKGHTFRTTTDTEVIVHLYEEDPEHFVEQLEGMFAFGLWDTRRQHLIVARDYLGIKPLYYYMGPECFVFASEIKALLADPRVPCRPDARGLSEILAFQNTYPGQTCFQDIALLHGGEIHTIQRDGTTRSRQFWTFEEPEPYRQDKRAEAAAELRSLVETVIHDHLLSDVPVASYLSGGMDTGTLTAVASHYLPALMTFSGGFRLDDAMPAYLRSYDEREAALLMSQAFGTQHHFREITPDDLLESFGAIAWHLEEPRGSPCYQVWVMAHEVGAKCKVILTGHGGDELFAGYRAKYQLAQAAGADWENTWFAQLNYLMPQAQASAWLHPEFMTPALRAWPRQVFDNFVGASRHLTPLGRTQHHDLFVYMHGLLLIEDKLSMAHSLESRVPFLDRRLFRFAWSLPDEWKLAQDRGKVLLREALQGLLPDVILTRDKMGFGPPDNHYYRTSLQPLLRALLLDGNLAQRGIVQGEMIQQLFQRQMQGEDLQMHLWTLASLEMWHRTFFDREAELRVTASAALPAPIVLHVPAPVAVPAAASPPLADGGNALPAQPQPRARTFETVRTLARPARALVRQARTLARQARALVRQARRLARPARPLAARLYRRGRTLLARVYHSGCALATTVSTMASAISQYVYTVVHHGPHYVRGLIQQLTQAPQYGLAKLRGLWHPNMIDYFSTWWSLVSGRYGVTMRTRLEQHLRLIPRPQRGAPLRVFHGLYHAPQPVFLNQAFKDKGLTSVYETLDFNPAFPMVDTHHQMHSPDIYREHVRMEHGLPIRINPPGTNTANLAQLEQFFLERWPTYDVFHFNWFLSFLPDNYDVEFLQRSGRPVYFHFRGCWVLENIVNRFTTRGESVVEACQHCQRMGWRDLYFSQFYRGVHHAARVFTSTPNLCHCSPEFEYLPNSLEPEMDAIPPPAPATKSSDEPIVVLHAPFNAIVHDKKGTPHVLRAVETLQQEGLNITLKLIQNMSRAEAVKQFGQGDIFVEQLHAGSYGNVGIEAMAYGLPVISSHHPAHAHLAPNCPVIHADPLTVTDRLRELVLDPARRADIGRKSYEWVRAFHSNERITTHLLRMYQEDLGHAEPRPRNTLTNKNPRYGE